QRLVRNEQAGSATRRARFALSARFSLFRAQESFACRIPSAPSRMATRRSSTDRPSDATPLVGVIMGSKSDLRYLQPAVDLLTELAIPHEVRVVSAHRTPDWMFEYASGA